MMSARVEQSPAYVLHVRPYRETSLLVDLFTLEFGKVNVIAKGARRSGSRQRFILQAFQPLIVSWYGKHALKNLTQAEVSETKSAIQGDALLCALYANELTQRLLPLSDPYPRIYLFYTYLINELAVAEDIEGALRTFERHLLVELGYDPCFSVCEPERFYHFQPGVGVVLDEYATGIKGDILLDIANDHYQRPEVRRIAKIVMRQAINHLLGDYPLKSRDLFKKMRNVS